MSKSFLSLLLLLVLLLPSVAPHATAQSAPDVGNRGFRSSPVMFIENAGQWPDAARFQVWGGTAGTMWLAEDAIWLTVVEQAADGAADSYADPLARFEADRTNAERESEPRNAANIRLSFVGANPHPRIEPFDPLDTVVSYFIGNIPNKWRPDVPVWGGVRYLDLYPGVDLEMASDGRRMVQRLVDRPGADLAAVQLRVEGPDAVIVEGDVLRLITAAGEFVQPLLRTGAAHVAGLKVQPGGTQAFEIHAPFAAEGTKRQAAVEKPQSPADNPADLIYGTFLGGSGAEYVAGSSLDGAGSVFAIGSTFSTDFPTTAGAFQRSFNAGNYDAFVVKLGPTGSGLGYASFLGGSGEDYGHAIVADGAGCAYIVGETQSTDFPTTAGAFDTSGDNGESGDGFVVKLSPRGNSLNYATFVAGTAYDSAIAVAVDAAGSAYVTGTTWGGNFPTTSGAFDTSYNAGGDAFVVKLDPSGGGLVYATFLGGSNEYGDGYEHGAGIAVDGEGSAYVCGNTSSYDFPVTVGAFDTSLSGGNDAFVVKLSSAGSTLVYSTFVGGFGSEHVSDIVVDGNGSAYVTGQTGSTDFPTTSGAFDTDYNGQGDVFVAKVSPSGNGLTYATYLGGSQRDSGGGISVDGAGRVSVSGCTGSTDFPTTPGVFDASFNGGDYDAFVVLLSPDGSSLAYATLVGGSADEYVGGISLDGAGSSYVAGQTTSDTFPTTPGAFDTSYNGTMDAFVVKLKMVDSETTYAITGRVADSSGNAMAGVTISADDGSSTTTDSNGVYAMSRLTAGIYTAIPSKPGYTFSPASRTLTVPPDATGQDFTARRLPVDPTGSIIDAQPVSLPADGESLSNVTVQLRDVNGQPAWGKTVRLSSDRGALDTIAQPTAVTDSQGIATGTVRSSTAGTATISALVYEDGVILTNTAAVDFEPYAPPSGEFLYRLNQMVDTALESLGYINEDAQEVAGYGDYFRGAIGEDAAKLGTDFLFGMMDIVGGVRDTRRLQKGVQLALPGMSKQFDGPFWPGILNPEQTFPAASDLFRADVWNLVRHHSIASSRSELAYGGAKFLAARARDTALEIITEKMAKQDVKNRFVYLDDGMTSSVAPAMRDAANELASLLDLTRDDLLADLPPMTPAYQAAYEDDLTGRTRALLVLEQQLDDERRTLVNFRQAHEQHPPELTNLLLRFGAKTAAEAVFDGPGRVAVGGTLLLFDSYMDGKQLSESVQMHQLAMDTLLGTPDALRQTYSDAFSAMARIGHSLPAQRATGEINSVAHWHDGRQHRSGWEERASWSEVSLTNTGDTETTFRVMAGYLADTTRFGVPWATWDLVAESEIILGPQASGTVRVDYKRANGTRGLSPRSRSCCTVPSAINIQVLGTNEAGTYYIDNDYSVWAPSRVSHAEAVAAGLMEDSPVIEPPLTSYVLSAPWTQRHEVQLWINNPFTTTVPVTVAQPLPASTILLDPGGGIESNGSVSWTIEVAASSLKAVTLTLSFPAAPGTANTLPPATLSLINPLDGLPEDFQSNAADFRAVWPLTLDREISAYVLPGATASAVISVTNWLPDAATAGTLTVSITDALSNLVYTESQPFSVPIGATSAINFTLPGTLAPGNYEVVSTVATAGATATAFTDALQVGLPGPQLSHRSSPAGPVYAGEVINYTWQFTNTTGVPLTSAVITASLPVSVTLVPGSITGGGAAETGQVRWTLAAIAPDQSVEESFAVQVGPDAAPVSGEPGQLLSELRLTAAEIAPAWGPSAWNLAVLPAVAPAVSISRSDNNAILTWPHHPANIEGYEVWWSADPYFTPGDDGSDHVTIQPVGDSGSYTHAMGGSAGCTYFVVLGVDGKRAKSDSSNRVGVFNFMLYLPSVLDNGGFEGGDYAPTGSPTSWSRDAWEPSNTSMLWDNTVFRSGSKSVKITQSYENDARWVQTAAVQPNRSYRISGWIKTEQVASGAGANLGVYGTWDHTSGLFGTNDWTFVTTTVDSGANTQMIIACRLGYWSGISTGTMWCDDVALELLD